MEKNNSNGRQHNVMTSTAEKATDQGKEKFAFYIGIDLGDKHCDVCVLNGEGEFEESFRRRMQGSDLQKRFAGIPRSRVAVEAGGQSRWVAELLEGVRPPGVCLEHAQGRLHHAKRRPGRSGRRL